VEIQSNLPERVNHAADPEAEEAQQQVDQSVASASQVVFDHYSQELKKIDDFPVCIYKNLMALITNLRFSKYNSHKALTTNCNNQYQIQLTGRKIASKNSANFFPVDSRSST
jgi:hypothetical protein